MRFVTENARHCYRPTFFHPTKHAKTAGLDDVKRLARVTGLEQRLTCSELAKGDEFGQPLVIVFPDVLEKLDIGK